MDTFSVEIYPCFESLPALDSSPNILRFTFSSFNIFNISSPLASRQELDPEVTEKVKKSLEKKDAAVSQMDVDM